MKRKGILFAAAMLAAAAARTASACGHCVEDRVAAVYDYRTELRAARDHLRIASLGVSGARPESAAAAARVDAALRETPIAVADTVRTSASPAAASFAWHGDDQALRSAMQSLNARLAGSGLHLELLKTWDAKRGLR